MTNIDNSSEILQFHSKLIGEKKLLLKESNRSKLLLKLPAPEKLLFEVSVAAVHEQSGMESCLCV